MNIKARYIISTLLFIILVVFFYAKAESQPTSIVYLSPDLNSAEILDELYEKGFIQNKFSHWFLSFYSKFNEKEIVSGGYNISKSMGALALHARLINPEYKYVSIEEGLRREEVANVYARVLGWNNEKVKQFANNIPFCVFSGGEGYLFPGKYAIHKDEVVGVIKQEMQNRLEETIEEISEKDEIDINKIITIASLIQREAADKGDMRLIAGVIWNRLKKNMPLQIDATLQYTKGDEELWWPQVHPNDKYLNSPYNTYKNKGLPPGPIANPGRAAIVAALNPTNTNCLYYLHDKWKNIHCSSTYAGHKINVNYYLK